jgi:site-specific recombinase XerD
MKDSSSSNNFVPSSLLKLVEEQSFEQVIFPHNLEHNFYNTLMNNNQDFRLVSKLVNLICSFMHFLTMHKTLVRHNI